MQVLIHPLTEFIDGNVSFGRGHAVPVDRTKALEWESRGLVRIEVPPAPFAGKALPAGEDPPSSASPAGPASPPTTAKPSTLGLERFHKRAK